MKKIVIITMVLTTMLFSSEIIRLKDTNQYSAYTEYKDNSNMNSTPTKVDLQYELTRINLLSHKITTISIDNNINIKHILETR